MCFTFLIMKPFPFALIYVNVSYPSSYHNQTFPHSTLSDTIQHRYTYSRHVRSAKRCGPRDTYSASSPITNLKLESAPGNYADGRNPAPVDAEVCSLPIIYRVLHIPGGAGVLPSTVCPWISETYLLLLRGSPFWPIKMSSNRYAWYC